MQEKVASLAQGRPYKQKITPPHRKPHDLKAAFAAASLRRLPQTARKGL
ncbi:hypothetical protein [Campylobacter gracilis]|uniref:Uncharacterized protein n=1 Tax=Campylobacter gracilis RM3268 TaxID=553220 RepID=C8PK67_9BACT|nr:hypothetical protein [Campylobacter gracilis]EEV16761.1 hypothetical protein CAMGR0001_1772 [Campylobacter gracilis RM3268]UEB44810.1 hypothetical protein LK410_07270 [Campylobacter gracilis]